LTGKPGHTAFEPISAVIGDGIRELTYETGTIRTKNGHDEVGFHECEKSRVIRNCQSFFRYPQIVIF
jgi:hypothetical protein